jgi:murein DD-endopeptidase MepM/ murein hydrolase activator NlpD
LLLRKAASSIVAGGHALRCRFEEGFVRAFAWLATTVYRLTSDWRGWRPLLTRTSAHLAVIGVAIIAIGLSNIEWRAQAAPILVPALSVAAGDGENEEIAAELLAELNGQNGEAHARGGDGINGMNRAVARLAQPHTNIPWRPRLNVITYTVQPGDTVQAIAATFVLSPTTILWANPAIEDAPDLLRIEQEVVILPIDGVYHKVVEADTLESIAEEYEVEPEAVAACQYNNLTAPGYTIEEGTWLIVPGGEKPYVPKVVTSYTGSVPEGARGTGRFQWPVLGRITQGYWYGHRAIDIGAPTGSAIQAADGGFVSFAGWTDVGYGYLVVIDHANGFVTYYAHESKVYVFVGQAVERGQVIGAVGSTGWSTGPHLHFEVRYYGVQQNPRAYLP